jgi:hypothetical protein
MHDEVADLEIAKIGKKCLRDRAPAFTAALEFRAVLFEDIGLGDDLQLGCWKPEPFGELANGDKGRDIQQLVGAIDQHSTQAIFGKELDSPFGATLGAGDKQHRVAALAHPLDLGDPFLDAAAKFDRRLAGNV